MKLKFNQRIHHEPFAAAQDKRIRREGFTLIEVMVALAIVSVSLVSIYSAFMGISDTLARMDNYNRSMLLGLEKMWEFEEAMIRGEEINHSGSSGHFAWEFQDNELKTYSSIREVNLTVRWQQGKRSGSFQASTYLRTVESSNASREEKQ